METIEFEPRKKTRAEMARDRANALDQQLEDALGKDVDTQQLQTAATERADAGGRALMAALAAQYAGEGYQPIQSAMLKRADALSGPMKVGSATVENGMVVRDPYAANDRRVQALDMRVKRAATAADQAEGQQERIEAQAQAQRERAADQADRAREAARDRAALAVTLAGMREADKTDSQAFTRATKLREEFGKKSDKIGEGVRHAETVMSLLTDPTIARDPTKQVSLVFAFGKMLDPESVVREGEYAMIANARGAFESLLQKPDQIMTGARLTPQQLQSMQQIAQQLYAGGAQRRQDLTNYYRGIAERNRIPVEDVLPMGSPRGGNDLAAAAAAELERRRKGGQ